jgi:selenocysteine lyase/cysteine desulfurase
VRWVDLDIESFDLDLSSLERVLGPKTRVVAFTLASHALGTVTAASEIVARVRAIAPEAIVVADAVHFAQHRLVDVKTLGADVLYFSPYKVFGPHLGVMWLRRELLERWIPYKVRPAPDAGPHRWETGTANHEGLAAWSAAVAYLAQLGGAGLAPTAPSRQAVVDAVAAIAEHESALAKRFLDGVGEVPGLRLYGRTDERRTPTFAVRLDGWTPRDLAAELGRRGVFVWDGNYYALEVMQRLGLEDDGGAVRIGFCHYNDEDDVERTLDELRSIAG